MWCLCLILKLDIDFAAGKDEHCSDFLFHYLSLSLYEIRNKFEIPMFFLVILVVVVIIAFFFLHVHTCVSVEYCLSAWKSNFHWQEHDSHSVISLHISESSKKQYLVKLDEDSLGDGHFFTLLLFEKKTEEILCNSIHRDRRLHSWKVAPFDMIK